MPVRAPRLLVVSVLLASALATGACATGGTAAGVPAPFPGAVVRATEAPAPKASALVATVVETALAQRGAPYRLGGTEPQKGFDCSGLVQFAFGQHDVDVPRTVAQQYLVGHTVDRRDLQRGDLVFFGPSGGPPTHVGIVVDSDSFVHAPDTGAVVRVEHLDTEYWRPRFRGAKRVI